MTTKADRIRGKAVRAILEERFPLAFACKPKQPLKLGIHKDIKKAEPTLSGKQITLGLQNYVSGMTYREATIAGAPRIDLNGDAVGLVTAEQEALAKQHIDRMVKANGKAK
jgi:ProP effector